MDKSANDSKEQESVMSAQRRATAEQLSQAFGAWFSVPPMGMMPQGASTPFGFPAGMASNPLLDLLKEQLKPLSPQRDVAPDQDVMRRFQEGLAAYRKHPAARAASRPAKVLWQQGTTVLRDYGADRPSGAAVFVVPSLINRFDILDLAPEHSFLRFMASAGLRPLVLDWGQPREEEKNFTITDYVAKRLMPAVEFLQPRVCGGRMHVIGYCMGGLLALALAVMKPDAVRSLVLMATPWNFSAAGLPGTALSSGDMFIKLAEQAEPHLAKLNCFPADALRLFFASFQPMQVMEKFARFANYDPTGSDAQRFVLSEDWLNDGVPLAAPVARECLREWYGENRPGKILWRVANTLIDPRHVMCPAYIVTPSKDKLVPPESARPLARLIRGATLHEPGHGHIGLLSSHAAPQEVWTPLVRWLLER